MGVCCLNRKEPIKLDTNNTNTTNKDNVIALYIVIKGFYFIFID
jgi:hypothetical protein